MCFTLNQHGGHSPFSPLFPGPVPLHLYSAQQAWTPCNRTWQNISLDIHGSREEGFTWVCYPNVVSFPRPPDEAATALRDLGFSSIIVPFYGNPHFVREGLHLRPVYQDRWLQVYSLGSP